MNRLLVLGTLIPFIFSTGLMAHSLRISSPAMETSQIILQAGSSGTTSLTRDSSFLLQRQFSIPRELPCFVVLETKSNLGGRVNLFLDPVKLPPDLQEIASKQENSVGTRSFQVVIDTVPGEWQQHTLDVAKDFFETVRPATFPYNPAGVSIKRIRIEAADPSRPKLEISIRGLKIVKLTGGAMKVDISARCSSIERSLEALQENSVLRRHWEPQVSQLVEEAGKLSETATDGKTWRQLAQSLEGISLQSRKWSLVNLPDKPYAVAIESSLRRVSGSHRVFTFRGSVVDEVQLQAGRNEYESFQLVILPLTKDLENVSIEVSDLVLDEGKGTIAARNLNLFHQIEQFVKPSKGTAYDWAGWLPDALQPLAGSFRIKNSATKPIWVTLYVPEDTAAGTYTGKIKVIPKGESETSVSVTVQIHDFSIPRVGRFRTQGHFSLEDLQAWYKDRYTAEVRKDFYRLLVKYRQSPTSQYSARLSPDPEDIPWIMREGGNVVLIGGFSGQDLDAEIIDPAYKWLVDNNYIDQAIIYVGDETDDFERMKAKARTIRRNWPKLRIMIGGSKPREELISYFDVWDPITYGGSVYNFDPASTKAAVERGEEMFWYTCVGPRSPYANVYNDHPLTATRALWWQAWKHEVTGFEYWWFNYWRPNIALSEGASPWPTSRRQEWNSRSFKWSNGDGILVYPGPKGKALPSVRLSVMRDAIEDWEVLFMLRCSVELARELNLPGAQQWIEPAEKLLEVPGDITASLTEWSLQPEVYFRARKKAYRSLSGLRHLIGGEQVDRYTENWVEEHQSWLKNKFEDRVTASG